MYMRLNGSVDSKVASYFMMWFYIFEYIGTSV